MRVRGEHERAGGAARSEWTRNRTPRLVLHLGLWCEGATTSDEERRATTADPRRTDLSHCRACCRVPGRLRARGQEKTRDCTQKEALAHAPLGRVNNVSVFKFIIRNNRIMNHTTKCLNAQCLMP